MPPPRVTEGMRLVLSREIARIEGRSPRLEGGAAGAVPLAFGIAGLDAALGGGLDPAGLHEILSASAGDSGAACGFALALAARTMAARGWGVMVSTAGLEREGGLAWGPGLAASGLDPARLALVRADGPAEAFWALEEALRSGAPTFVAGFFAGLPGLYDLTVSRRLALAAREARLPALLVFAGRGGLAAGMSSAATTRWEIAAAPGPPGLAGEPARAHWRVHLLRNRGGEPRAPTLLDWDHDDRSFAEPASRRGDRPALPADRPGPAVAAGGQRLRRAG